MKKKLSIVLFVFLLTGTSVYYNYHKIVLKRPQSIHKWRQSDCASIALNYYQGGMKFFQPETHNLTSDGGTSGKCYTSEIPILYYSVALLYKILGYHDWVYRVFNTFLFFLGLFYLFRLLLYLVQDTYWAIALTILFFTSPVLVYYGNNYLSNSSALAFSIIGWYYFVRFSKEDRVKWIYISMIAFLLAASFKITALFSVFAIVGIYFLELSGYKKLKNQSKIFNHHLDFLLPLFLIFIITGLWIFYAHFNNQKHGCTYFSTTIFPVWDYNLEEIKGILNQVKKIWLPEYFHFSVLMFITICVVFVLINFKKNNQLLFFSVVFILLEAIVYIILQFWTFADHDYYTIDLYIFPVLVVVTTFDLLKKSFGKVFNSLAFKVIFSLFLIYNIQYARKSINYRYDSDGWMNDYSENKGIYTITPYLRQIGVLPKDTIISIPDGSHASLYLMNQKGWTEYTDAKFMRGKPIRYNQDSIGIQLSVNRGARYLIIKGIEQLYSKPYLQGYCNNLVGNYNNVLIFNLKDRKTNFSLEKRETEAVLTCDAETLSEDKQYFIGTPDSTIFEAGKNQSNESAHSGRYSVKLTDSSPFGMTIRLGSLKNGESFEIFVWRKSVKKGSGHLIASSEPNPFYNNKFKIVEKNPNGWEKLYMEFYISSELSGQELNVYVYNPDKSPVYFDDLRIVRYKSITNFYN